ncbi:polysaccharide lyase, partial [Thraustotheca clavata]
MRLLYAAFAFILAPFISAEELGYSATSDGSKWIITSGSGLVVTMLRSSCDIVSLKYNNQELQYKSANTHINSGLGSVTSSIKTLSDAKKTIQITCSKTGLTQYYFFRPNENMIYMGTYHSKDLQLPELRFLARLSRSVVTSGITAAALDGFDVAVEAEDVVANSAGITRSKFYSGVPHIDDTIHGAFGSKVGVYFVMSPQAYETSI